MNDHLDAIMRVMEAAFDPAYGEAWNRRQISDALILPNTHFILADRHGHRCENADDARGFAMSRGAADEEELLLLAVEPAARGFGVGSALMEHFMQAARKRGVRKLFLEMRDGNPAGNLYLKCGFSAVGRRKDYYRSGLLAPVDAITFANQLD